MAKKTKKEKEPGSGGFFSRATKAFGGKGGKEGRGEGGGAAPAADVDAEDHRRSPTPEAIPFTRTQSPPIFAASQHAFPVPHPHHPPSRSNTAGTTRVKPPSARSVTPSNHLFGGPGPAFDFSSRIPATPTPAPHRAPHASSPTRLPQTTLSSAFRTYDKGKGKAAPAPAPATVESDADPDASDEGGGGPWGHSRSGHGHAQEWSGATEQSYAPTHHHTRQTGTYEDIYGAPPEDDDDTWGDRDEAQQHPQEWNGRHSSHQASPTRGSTSMPVPTWPEPEHAQPIPPPRPPSTVWAGANRGPFGAPSSSTKPAAAPQPSAGGWPRTSMSVPAWQQPSSQPGSSMRTSGQWPAATPNGMPAWGAPPSTPSESSFDQQHTPKATGYPGGFTGYAGAPGLGGTHQGPADGGWHRNERFQPALSRILSVSQASNARAPTEVTSVSRNPPNPKHASFPVPPPSFPVPQPHHERIPSHAFVDRHEPPASKFSMYDHNPAQYPTPGRYSAGGNPKMEFGTAAERVRAAAARPIGVPGASKTMAMATHSEDLEHHPQPHPQHPPQPNEARPLSADGSELEYIEDDMPITMSPAVLADAQMAFYGKHRMAAQRLFWTLPPEHDARVVNVLNWVLDRSDTLATLGIQQFLASRSRGALITNVSYRTANVPRQPAFHWISWDKAQPTLDKILQESISTYNPLTTTIVFVFLPSKTRNSVGIWRRKLPMPHNVQAEYGEDVGSLKAQLDKVPYVVHVDQIPKGHSQHPDFEKQKRAAAGRVADVGRTLPPGMLIGGNGASYPLRTRSLTPPPREPPTPTAPAQRPRPTSSRPATTRLAKVTKQPAPAPAAATPAADPGGRKWLGWGR